MGSATASSSAQDLSAFSPHNIPGLLRMVVHGFPRYQKTVASLDVLEYIKLRVTAEFIAESYKPGALPIIRVRLIGHADRDFQRGAKFEQDISEDRARQIRAMLQSEVARLTWTFSVVVTPTNTGAPSPSDIDWVPTGVGASEPDPENVRRHKTPQNMNEADRKLNRRVEIILEPGTTPVPDTDVAAIIRDILDQKYHWNAPPNPGIPSDPPLPPWFWKPNFPPPKSDEWKKLKKQIKETLHLKNIDLDTIIDSINDALHKDPSNGGWSDDLRNLEDDLEKARLDGLKEWWKDDDDD
jgi:hypothetical protein